MGTNSLKDLVITLNRFYRLETVIAELEACDKLCDSSSISELTDYLNKRADGLPNLYAW
jgi:hypothetical protein